mmetsp:Transcript_15461/g.36752  ORF Transcript_15461/g.36752 Transcript_15461/m.36752 type:complete len:879 (-) Transcript_15461:208-2844(-)
MAEETTKATTPVGASMTEAAPRTSFDILRTNFIKGGGLSDFVETPWDHNNYRVRFNRAGNICCGEKADQLLLEKPAKVFSLDVNRDTRGTFLRADASVTSSLHVMDLGVLHCSRFLACAKKRFCWMEPSWGSKASEVPPETQFLLIRMSEPTDGEQTYAIILPLLAGSFRTCLEAGEKGTLALRVESGDADVQSHRLQDLAFVSWGPDPFALVKRSLGAVADKLQSFALRESKELPLSLDLFGWCTWDAFYSSVDGDGIIRGLQAFRDGGVPARTLIIDDGWQDTAHDADSRKQTGFRASLRGAVRGATKLFSKWYGAKVLDGAAADSAPVALYGSLATHVLKKPVLANFISSSETSDFTKRLQSAKASARFAGSLRGSFPDFVAKLKADFGLGEVYCWHALFGYWSGLRPSQTDSEDTASSSPFSQNQGCEIRSPQPMGGILRVEPQLKWDPLTLNGVGMVPPSSASSLYTALHAYLAACGVDGVKVDAQSLASMMGQGAGGSAHVARSFVQAMEESVGQHFGTSAQCINCMCHATECLYAYRTTSVGRASDDFWPRDPASQTVHIANVVYNSLFIGEILQPDWDMFQSSHESAALHAVARAVGGCAVYVSDQPGKHNFELLRRLVLPDGSILRAQLPGRPTRDCLFSDVVGDGESALKIWNRNSCNGVVAAMNIQGAHWDRATRKNVLDLASPTAVSTAVRPSDVSDLEGGKEGGRYAMLATYWKAHGELKSVEKHVVASEEGVGMTLEAKETSICTIAPMRYAVAEDGRRVEWAALGLEGMLNGGAAVLGQRERVRSGGDGTTSGGPADAEIQVRGTGTLLVHCDARPVRVVHVSGEGLSGSERLFAYSEADQMLRIAYELAETRDGGLRLQIHF